MSPTIILPTDGGALKISFDIAGTSTLGGLTFTTELDGPKGLHIRPGGVGSLDGSSWSDAGALSQLGAFIAKAAVGTTIFIRADEGPYSNFAGATVSRGDGLIYIQGVNGDYSPGMAQIEGNRAEWVLPADPEAATWTVGWTPGGSFIKFVDGAAHLRFYGLDLRRFGDTFYNTATKTYLDDIVIAGCAGYNVRRFFEQSTAVQGSTNVTIKDVTVTGFSKTCIRFQNDSHDCRCENVHANSGRQNGDNFAMGFQCESTLVPSHHITFDRCIAENCHSTSAGLSGYAQGDGFVAEYGVHDCTWIDCISRGNTDGGWDIKGRGHKLIRCTGEDNKRNLRNWALDTQALGWTGRNARKRYGGGSQREIWCGSTSGQATAGIFAHVTLDTDQETGQKSLIDASKEAGQGGVCEKDKGGYTINNTDITKPTAVPMVFSASSGGGGFTMDAYTTSHIVNV